MSEGQIKILPTLVGEQARASGPEAHIWLSASAGTGKTQVLSARVLRLLLEPQHRESFSGDLLEEYRESIHPARGRRRAQRWYVRQVGALAWRQNRVWGLLLGASFVGRTAVDWLMPTTQFQVRSMVLTALSVAILLGAGFWAVRRSKSLGAGALGGLATVVVAGLVDAVGAMLLLALAAAANPRTF